MSRFDSPAYHEIVLIGRRRLTVVTLSPLNRAEQLAR